MRNSVRILWTTTKWTGGILGYVLGSIVVAVVVPFLYLIHLCKGQCDDAPGTGLFLMFVGFPLLALFLAIGVFLLIEILYCRLFSKTKVRRLRLLLRELLGVGSLVGPVWIYLFWPLRSEYRSRFETPAMELLIYAVSVLMLLIAVFLPFHFHRAKLAAISQEPKADLREASSAETNRSESV